jgi:hypothetical protein
MLIDNVESIKSLQKFGAQNITYSNNEPSSPANNDLWFENPLLVEYPYTQPWIWNSAQGLWLSQPFHLNFGTMTLSNNLNIEKALFFSTLNVNKILVKQVCCLFQNNGVDHTTANYYQFYLRHTNNNNNTNILGETNIYNLDTNTGTGLSNTFTPLLAGQFRRALEFPNVWIPSTAWSLRFSGTRLGTGVSVIASATAQLQIAKTD